MRGRETTITKDEFQLKEKAIQDEDNENNKGQESTKWDKQPPTQASFSMEAHFGNLEDYDITIVNW